jgi:uncharacterized protein YjbI with pentapeptide repeats
MAKKENHFIFEKEYYEEHSFEKINAGGNKFTHLEFFNCSFLSCQFANTIFENCVFEKCVFKNCDLSVAKFSGSSFVDIEFEDCKLLGIDWTLAQKPSGLNFIKCILNDSTFNKMDLRSSEIKECIAHNTDFENANLSKTICAGTDFLNAKFNDADLSSADFTSAINYSINPNKTKIKKAKFSLPEAVNLLDAWDLEIE